LARRRAYPTRDRLTTLRAQGILANSALARRWRQGERERFARYGIMGRMRSRPSACKEPPTMPDASSATNTTTQTATPALNLNAIRAAFPSLGFEQNGQPVVYFDNPGGTQVPQACIDAITHYLSSANANTGGAFLTSQRTDAVLAEAHAAMADFLNA